MLASSSPGSIRHHTVQLPDVRLHVAEAGQGIPVILLHGWPEFWATWRPLMTRLGNKFRLLAPDFRGFGESENPYSEPNDTVTADRLADDIAALMGRMSVERASFVGHDTGAYVMQRLALRYPDKVDRLFFFNCPTHGIGARWREAEHINEIWYQSFNQMPFAAQIVGSSRQTCRAFIGHFLRHWSHRKEAFKPLLEDWVDNFMRPGNLQGGFNWYLSQNAGRLAVMAGTAAKPPVIPHPTQVLWGRHDPVLKAEWADVLPDHFADIDITFAEDCGHFVHVEDPDLAAARIAGFFNLPDRAEPCP